MGSGGYLHVAERSAPASRTRARRAHAPFSRRRLDPRVQAWMTDSFVGRALSSSDFAELGAELRQLAGYLAVYPDTGGTYVAHWKGQVSAVAPSHSPEGHEVRHVGNTRIEPLIARSAAEITPTRWTIPNARWLRARRSRPPPPCKGIGPEWKSLRESTRRRTGLRLCVWCGLGPDRLERQTMTEPRI